MPHILKKLCAELAIPEDTFSSFINDAESRIKHSRLKKKNGSYRKIIIPPWEFKIIQYWLILEYLRSIPINEYATAFHKGANIIKNATQHVGHNYFLKVDIKNFFPSISESHFKAALMSYPQSKNIDNLLKAIENEHLLKAIFYRKKCTIGYPISPYIANIAMKNFDEDISNTLQLMSKRLGKFSYTRYADDIVISSERGGIHNELMKMLKKCLKKYFGEELIFNPDKTKQTTLQGGGTLITGLRLCSDGRITLHRKYKDHIRLLFSLYKNNHNLEESEKNSLIGHLNYCKFSDPEFFNKLMLKYYAEIKKLTEK